MLRVYIQASDPDDLRKLKFGNPRVPTMREKVRQHVRTHVHVLNRMNDRAIRAQFHSTSEEMKVSGQICLRSLCTLSIIVSFSICFKIHNEDHCVLLDIMTVSPATVDRN